MSSGCFEDEATHISESLPDALISLNFVSFIGKQVKTYIYTLISKIFGSSKIIYIYRKINSQQMDYRAVAKGSDSLLNIFFLSVWIPARNTENLHGKDNQ